MSNKRNNISVILPWAVACVVFLFVLLGWYLAGTKEVEKVEEYIENDIFAETVAANTGKQYVSAAMRAVVSICYSPGAKQHPGFTGLTGTGSGVVISPDGYILTASANIKKGRPVSVGYYEPVSTEGPVLEQGHRHIIDAVIIISDPSSGLALIKITAGILPAVLLGNSGALSTGNRLLGLASPFGKKPTAFSGRISSLNNSTRADGTTYRGLIEMTKNGGKDFIGGPVVNSRGEAVGILIDGKNAVKMDRAAGIIKASRVRLR